MKSHRLIKKVRQINDGEEVKLQRTANPPRFRRSEKADRNVIDDCYASHIVINDRLEKQYWAIKSGRGMGVAKRKPELDR